MALVGLADLWNENSEKVDNFGKQLPPELREFLVKIIVPLQRFILDDYGELDLVLNNDTLAW